MNTIPENTVYKMIYDQLDHISREVKSDGRKRTIVYPLKIWNLVADAIIKTIDFTILNVNVSNRSKLTITRR